jgi:hypothetical protein
MEITNGGDDPPEEIFRIRSFLVSAMKTLPVLSTATPVGEFSCALLADPPSPE